MTRSKSSKYKKKNTKKSQPPKSLALTLGATALLILGGGLAYLVFANRGGDSTLPVGSRFLPADTSSSLTLTTQDKQWEKLQDFNIPQTRQFLKSGLTNLNQDLLEPFGFDYERDLKPWIGRRMTVATLTPQAKDTEVLAETSQAWIFQVGNSGRAQKFVQQGLAVGGNSPTKTTYQGVEIQTISAQPEELYVTLLEKKHVVMTNDLPAMREVIDTSKAEKSLAAQERFLLAMEEIKTSDPLAQIYFNVPANTSQLFEQEGRQVDEATLNRLQDYQGMGSSVELTDDGLQLNAISWLHPDSTNQLTVTGAPQGITKMLPANTFLMTSGDSFQQVWNDYQKGVETQLLLPFSPKSLQSNFTKFTGLNFEQKFLPWMTGSFAAGVVPNGDKAKNAGVAFLVKVNDKTAAENALRELEAKMQEKYSFQMSETKVNDQSVVRWRVPPNLPIASRGWLSDKTLFFTMFAPITEQITKPESSLSSNELFKTASRSELTPKSGQFFFDVTQLTKFMGSSPFLPKLTPEYQKYAKEFESVGGTSTTLNDWSTRYQVNVGFLKK